MIHFDNAIGLVVRNSTDYVRQFFNCLERGETVVPLRSADDTDRIRVCGLQRVIASADEHGWSSALELPLQDNDALAQIAFTSGTEGEPKGVLLTHRNLADPVRRLQLVMGLDASVREYIGVPVYHSFGLGRCRTVTAAGGRFYVPPKGLDLRELVSMIDAREVNAISLVPTLWRLVLRNRALFEKNADRVRWIKIGSQAMSGEEKRALRELFPQARIVQHYGLTEASRTTLLDIGSATDDELDSVGKPYGQVEIKISNDGRIMTRGPHVARELLVSGRRVPNTDAQGWCVTQDLGECRGGHLFFRGRADDVINLGGLKVSPDMIENEMRAALGVEGGFCVTRVADALRGETVLVAALNTLPASDEALVSAAGDSLARAGIDARSSVQLTRMTNLPTTDAGKIMRKAVAQQYLDRAAPRQASRHGAGLQTVPPVDPHLLPEQAVSQVGGSESIDTEHGTRPQPERHGQPRAALNHGRALPAANCSSNERVLVALYTKATGRPLTDMSSTLRNAGADSLSIVEIRLELDTYIGHVPDNWIDLSIRELASLFSLNERPSLRRAVALKSIDAFILCRALAILFVVAHHFHWFVVPGGSTTLLFVIGGYLYLETNKAAIYSGGETSGLWSGLIILVATLVPITVFQALAHSYFGSNWNITLLIPFENISNYLNAQFNLIDKGHHVHWLWFIHVYIQVFFVIALALSFSRVRMFMAEKPYARMLATFFILEFISAAIILSDSPGMDLRHSATLLQYAPTTIIPIIVYGALIALTKSRLQFAATILAGASYAALYAGGVFTQGGITTLVTVALLLFVKTVKVPSALLRPTMMVSEASLFIYLTHMPFQFGVQKILKWDMPPALLSAMAILVSVGLWQVWKSLVVSRIRGLRSSSWGPRDRVNRLSDGSGA